MRTDEERREAAREGPDPRRERLVAYLWTHPQTGEQLAMAPEDVTLVYTAPATQEAST
jgi:hypothetical protein